MSTYFAIVCRIHVRPHPGADRLQLGTCYGGNQVVVGLDTKDGELGIFFPSDGQLSEEFCRVNDLFPRFDDQGRRVGGGFFDPKNRRVRAQSFRGEKSEGFWCPLHYLNGLLLRENIDNLKEGDQFIELNGVAICNKYETEATKQAAVKSQKTGASKKHEFFKEHLDTKQFVYESDKIPAGSILHLSEKLHGTSGRYGFFSEKLVFSGWKKYCVALMTWISAIVFQYSLVFVKRKFFVGSRRVQLKSPDSPTSFYGDESFRFLVANGLKDGILLGETVYGELVGYQGPNTPIMGTVSTLGLADKAFRATYGETMTYKYGCPPGTSKFYVYRITQTNEDGHVTELSVEQVKARCKILGYEYVPEFSGAIVHTDTEALKSLVESFLDGPSVLDASHIREGVAIRVDTPDGATYFLKHKSFNFKVLEGIIKDQTDYVDTEESA